MGLDAVEDALEAERQLATRVRPGLVRLARGLADPACERVVAMGREGGRSAGVGLPPIEVGRPGLLLGLPHGVLGAGDVGREPHHEGDRLVHLDVVESDTLEG